MAEKVHQKGNGEQQQGDGKDGPEFQRPGRQVSLATIVVLAISSYAVAADDEFVNFESGQTRPLALSPDGSQLFVVNTEAGRLEIFDVGGAGLTRVGSIPVGLEPVAVAVRENISEARTEAWVVNLLSDSVSIVAVDASDPARSRIVRTLLLGDEPRDIVFAGPAREGGV